jgi:hypothetical protein
MGATYVTGPAPVEPFLVTFSVEGLGLTTIVDFGGLELGNRPVLLGIDLVDQALTEGDFCEISYSAGVGGTIIQLVFFRGFTYASSQGYYAWRGEVPLLNNPTISGHADGTTPWVGQLWGYYLLTPGT